MTTTSSDIASGRHRAAAPRPRARVGVFGIGLEAYWPQFDGLRERVEGYQRRVEERVAALGGEVVSAGLVDTAQGAREAGDRFARGAGRPRALPRGHLRDVEPGAARPPRPPKVAGRAARPAADARRSTTRTPARASGWPTARPAACRSSRARSRARGIPYDTVAGTIDDDERAWAKIGAWVRAAGVARALRRSRIGFLGHTYPGMLDMYSDFTAVHAQLGAHVEVLEIDDLGARVAAATDDGGRGQAGRDPRRCSTSPTRPTTRSPGRSRTTQLDWSARVAVGLDRLAADFELDALTYYYRGVDGNEAERLGAGVIVGNSLLTARGDPDRGRGRPQDERRPADPRPARRGRLVHRVLRARLRRGLRPHGPRRPDARRDRRGPPDAARAAALPRQARRRAERRGQGPLRAGHDRRLHADRRRARSSCSSPRASRSPARRSASATRTAACASASRPPSSSRRWCARGPDPPRRARRRPRRATRWRKVASLLGLEFARVG